MAGMATDPGPRQDDSSPVSTSTSTSEGQATSPQAPQPSYEPAPATDTFALWQEKAVRMQPPSREEPPPAIERES